MIAVLKVPSPDRRLRHARTRACPLACANHLPSRHDDGTATAELHEVDLVISGTEQHQVGDPEVEHQRLRAHSLNRAGFAGDSVT